MGVTWRLHGDYIGDYMDITLYYGWYVPEPDRTVRDTAFPIFSFEVVCDNTPPKTTNPGAKIPEIWEICDAEMVIPLGFLYGV